MVFVYMQSYAEVSFFSRVIPRKFCPRVLYLVYPRLYLLSGNNCFRHFVHRSSHEKNKDSRFPHMSMLWDKPRYAYGNRVSVFALRTLKRFMERSAAEHPRRCMCGLGKMSDVSVLLYWPHSLPALGAAD